MRLDLAWPWHYRWWGLLAGVVGGACVSALPLTWALRPVAAITFCLLSVVLWAQHWRRLPLALSQDPGGRLRLRSHAGDWLEVERIDLGVARPWLLSARLHAGGCARDLFVPGGTLGRDAHWRLRRLVRLFREPAAREADQPQPPGR